MSTTGYCLTFHTVSVKQWVLPATVWLFSSCAFACHLDRACQFKKKMGHSYGKVENHSSKLHLNFICIIAGNNFLIQVNVTRPARKAHETSVSRRKINNHVRSSAVWVWRESKDLSALGATKFEPMSHRLGTPDPNVKCNYVKKSSCRGLLSQNHKTYHLLLGSHLGEYTLCLI